MINRVILAVGLGALVGSVASMTLAPRHQAPGGLAATGVPQDPSAVGYLNLHKRHPDAAEGAEEFATMYSADLALQRLTQMESFLMSFRDLTKRVRGTLGRVELSAIGNTDASIQTIGFHNIPLVVEGTLLKQDYQLKQVQYEFAQLKRARGDITAEDLDRARDAYARATKRLQVFWDTKLPTD